MKVFTNAEGPLPAPSKALSSLSRLTPQLRAMKRPSLHPTPRWLEKWVPGLLLSCWEGEEGLSSLFFFLPSSFPPPSVCSPRLLERLQLEEGPLQLLPSDLSSHYGGLFRHPLFPTRIPAVPQPKPANPAPPSATPSTVEPRASLGSRRNRLQNARARSPLAPRAVRRLSLRPLPRPPPSRLG